jgi:glycosyltransferase involved in cell wall biosynthesis
MNFNHNLRNDSIYIIIPVFNERQTIKQVVESLLVLEYNIVIVDDGSTDATGDCLNDLPVFYLRHEINLGQGAALQTGIEFALQRDAEIVISFDGDGQHQATDLANLIKPLVLHEANVVLGSRFLPAAITNIPFFKKQAILLARVIHYLFTGLWLSDAHNGLRAFDRKAASMLDLKENRMAHASEILFKLHQYKVRIKEVPVSILYSEYSRSKGQSVFSGIKIFFDILLNRIFE